MGDFPQLGVTPGEYDCEWFLADQAVPGRVELQGNRFPKLTLYDDLPLGDESARTEWNSGERHDFERLHGRLRSNQDVVVLNGGIGYLFFRQRTGYWRYAIVGMGVADVREDRYERISLQVTGSDLLFDMKPIKDVPLPGRVIGEDELRYSVVLSQDSHRCWKSPDMAIKCGYDRRPLVGLYRFEILFAPVIEFTAESPLTLDEWVHRWIRPLVGIASLATGEPQHVAWLQVHGKDVRGVVFGKEISQAPYPATDERRSRLERPPLFTLKSLPVNLPNLLEEWRTLETGRNPFLEIYASALVQPDLPQRARFLYLIQALEGLHAYENHAAEENAQRTFESERKKLLDEIRELGLARASQAFLNKSWPKRKSDALSRRLSALLSSLPLAVREDLEDPEMAAIAPRLSDDGGTALEKQLEKLRNQISHGGCNYADSELAPWVRAVEVICQAHLLRLLGFDAAAIEHGVVRLRSTRSN